MSQWSRKTHIGCGVSLVSADISGGSDCDICGGEPTVEKPVLRFEVTRKELPRRKRKEMLAEINFSAHRECLLLAIDRWLGGAA